MRSPSEPGRRWRLWAPLAALALILTLATRTWADHPDASGHSPGGVAAAAPNIAPNGADPLPAMWDARADHLDELQAMIPELTQALEAAPDPAAKAIAAVRLGTTQAAVGDFGAALKTLSSAAKAAPADADNNRARVYSAWYDIARRSGKAEAVRGAAEAIQKAFKGSSNAWEQGLNGHAEQQLKYADRIGKTMAAFSGKTIQGPEFKLSSKRGKLVFVHFWGVW